MRSRLAGAVCCVVAALVVAVSTAMADGDRQAEYIQLRLLIGQQHFSEALDRCRALVAKYPDYVYLYETMAEIALYAQDLAGAAKFFEERIEDGTGLEFSYFGLGTVYYNMEAYREAALCFDRAIELGISAPECYRNFVYAYERLEGVDACIRFFNSLCHRNPKNAHLWYAVALAYWSKRDYQTVLKKVDEALGRSPDEQKYLQAKAAALLLNRDPEASHLISGLISSNTQSDDLNGMQFLRSYLVLSYDLSGDTSNAKYYTLANLKEAQDYGLYRWVGWGYERMADFEFLSSNFERCLIYSSLAVEASRRCSDHNLLSAAMVRQYDSHMELGDFKKALESVYSRLLQFNNSNPLSDSIRAFIDIAWAYHELGDENTAMEYAIESLNRAETSKQNSTTLLRIHSTLGLIYEGLGNYEAASNNFLRSMQYIESDRVGTQNLAIVHGNIGRSYMDLGKLTKSLFHFTAECKIARNAGFEREEAYSHNHLGQFYLRCGNLGHSKKEFLKGLFLGRKLGQRQVMIASTRGLAEIAELQGDLTESVKLYKDAIDSCEGIGLPNRYPWTRSSLEKERQTDLRECARILCKLGRYEEAFLMSETSKLNNVPYAHTIRHRMMESLPAWKGKVLARIEGEILRKRNELALEKQSVLSSVESPNFLLTDQTARLEADYYRILDGVAVENPLTRNGIKREAETAKAVQANLLDTHEALLEFSVSENEVNIFLLKRDTLICRSIKLARRDLRKMVSDISDLLGWERSRVHLLNATLANFNAKASHKLYAELMGWSEAYLGHVESLVIVADDILRGFPFELLLPSLPLDKAAHDFAGANFLLNQFSVRYVHAASLLKQERNHRPSPVRFLLAIGDPWVSGPGVVTTPSGFDLHLASSKVAFMPHLPGAQKEVRMLQSLLGSRADVATKEEASKRRLLSGAKDYRVIHIASHTTVDAQDPLFSCIYLADDPETGESGILHGFELLDAEINADLVVLNSCNSGQVAADAKGSGIVDAFLIAGVPSAVAALWSVDDQSGASLIERFYTYLSQGHSKSTSLQKAKIDLIRSGKVDPFYWAGFVLIGDGGQLTIPVAHSKEWSSWVFASSLSTLVAVTVFAFWIRRRLPHAILQLLATKKQGLSSAGRRD